MQQRLTLTLTTMHGQNHIKFVCAKQAKTIHEYKSLKRRLYKIKKFTLLHLVGILFPHINDDARSKSHQTETILQHTSKWFIANSLTLNFKKQILFNFLLNIPKKL